MLRSSIAASGWEFPKSLTSWREACDTKERERERGRSIPFSVCKNQWKEQVTIFFYTWTCIPVWRWEAFLLRWSQRIYRQKHRSRFHFSAGGCPTQRHRAQIVSEQDGTFCPCKRRVICPRLTYCGPHTADSPFGTIKVSALLHFVLLLQVESVKPAQWCHSPIMEESGHFMTEAFNTAG